MLVYLAKEVKTNSQQIKKKLKLEALRIPDGGREGTNGWVGMGWDYHFVRHDSSTNFFPISLSLTF